MTDYTSPLENPSSISRGIIKKSDGSYIHTGLDMTASLGDQVGAAASGTVIWSGNQVGGYGNTVVIRDNVTGVAQLYAHLDSIDSSVIVGANINTNQIIGQAGATGRVILGQSTAVLHFEILPSGTAASVAASGGGKPGADGVVRIGIDYSSNYPRIDPVGLIPNSGNPDLYIDNQSGVSNEEAAAGAKDFISSSTNRIVVDNGHGVTDTYHTLTQHDINIIAQDAGLTVDQLLAIAGNEHWQDRYVTGANGGNVYLAKQGDTISVAAAEDNDFAYVDLKYQVDSQGKMIFGADGKPLIYNPTDAFGNYINNGGDEQGFLDIAGQKLVSWLDDVGMSVSGFFNQIGDIATNPDTTIYEKTLGAFTYTGAFVEDRMNQIFGHGASIGLAIGNGFEAMDPERYFNQREVTDQNINLVGSVLIGESDTARVGGFVNMRGDAGIMLNFTLQDITSLAGGVIDFVQGIFGGVMNLVSPLTFDIDGDGIELSQAYEQKVFFDIDNDGFAEKVGWVNADDGMLARDNDGSGTIDNISELFGDDEMPAFQKLAANDNNRIVMIRRAA